MLICSALVSWYCWHFPGTGFRGISCSKGSAAKLCETAARNQGHRFLCSYVPRGGTPRVFQRQQLTCPPCRGGTDMLNLWGYHSPPAGGS